jgi:hypothetical protein
MSKHKILVVLILALGLSCCANAELVGWWKLDETEGTEAWDSSGNELHGEVIGGTKWIPNGRFGGALEFDGVGTAGTNVSLPTGTCSSVHESGQPIRERCVTPSR